MINECKFCHESGYPFWVNIDFKSTFFSFFIEFIYLVYLWDSRKIYVVVNPVVPSICAIIIVDRYRSLSRGFLLPYEYLSH